MEDDRDFIGRSQAIAEKVRGRATTTDEIASEFAGYDPAWRPMTLDRLDAEISRDEPLTLNGARRPAEAVVCRRALGDIHETLRKAGR
jgi:hypothetical protein